jgi:hypothetical protein
MNTDRLMLITRWVRAHCEFLKVPLSESIIARVSFSVQQLNDKEVAEFLHCASQPAVH